MEQPSNEAKDLCSDFVLHAGGLVWAMDWCPSDFVSFDSEYKCEYLAISAHPPGSTYHKIGVTLNARGIIQIWCLLTRKESAEISSSSQRKPKGKFSGVPSGKPRGRPKGAKSKRKSSADESVETSLLIQKNLKEVTYEQYISAEEKEDPSYYLFEGETRKNLTAQKLEGGRTRSYKKQLSSAVNKKSEVSDGDLVLLNFDYSDANGNAKELTSLPSIAEPSCDFESSQQKQSGKRNKKTESNTNVHAQELGSGEGNDEIKLPIFGDDDAFSEVIKSLKLRSNKSLNAIKNECVRTSIAQTDENLHVSGETFPFTSAVPHQTTSTLEVEEYSSSLRIPAVTDCKMDSVLPMHIGQPKKQEISSTKERVSTSGSEVACSTENQMLERKCKRGEACLVNSCEDIDSRLSVNKCTLCADRRFGIDIDSRLSVNKCTLCADRRFGLCYAREAKGSTTCRKKRRLEDKAEKSNALAVTTFQPKDHCNSEMVVNKCTLCADRRFGTCYARTAKGSTTCRKKRRLEDKAENSNALAVTTSQPKDHCNSEMVIGNARSDKTFHIPKDSALPKVVLCLAHMGKVAWDVKWRPVSIIESEEKHSLGYLAALLGDGSLKVWEVPLPNIVNIIHTSHGTDETDPRFMKLQPVFKCSKVMHGDRLSIPLTMEWSTSAPHDLILAGCHNGTVAIWKFSKQSSTRDINPLLCFSADNVPIRSLAWAPIESDTESANVIVTAGHEGIKLWDIRDPYRPLWEYNPVQKIILSLQWLQNPRCLVMTFDDGFIRILSLWRVANGFLATGEPLGLQKQFGLRSWCCSPFAIWNCHISRATDIAAYCTADGYTRYFKLTSKAVQKEASCHREPHYISSSFRKEDETTLKIGTPFSKVAVPNIPMKKVPSEMGGDAPLYSHIDAVKQATGGKFERRRKRSTVIVDIKEKPETNYEKLPPKEVAIHRSRWNLNKGSERWLCSGGAAGLVRCQKIYHT